VAGVLARPRDHQLIAVTEAARANTEIDDVLGSCSVMVSQ
jgi:hypothetical protein